METNKFIYEEWNERLSQKEVIIKLEQLLDNYLLDESTGEISKNFKDNPDKFFEKLAKLQLPNIEVDLIDLLNGFSTKCMYFCLDFGRYSKYLDVKNIQLFLTAQAFDKTVNDNVSTRMIRIESFFITKIVNLIKKENNDALKYSRIQQYRLDVPITKVDIPIGAIINSRFKGKNIHDANEKTSMLLDCFAIFTANPSLKDMFSSIKSKVKDYLDNDTEGYLFINLVTNDTSLHFDIMDLVALFRSIYHAFEIPYLRDRVFITFNQSRHSSRFFIDNQSLFVLNLLRYLDLVNKCADYVKREKLKNPNNDEDALINEYLREEYFKKLYSDYSEDTQVYRNYFMITTGVPFPDTIKRRTHIPKSAPHIYYYPDFIEAESVFYGHPAKYNTDHFVASLGFLYYKCYDTFNMNFFYQDVVRITSDLLKDENLDIITSDNSLFVLSGDLSKFLLCVSDSTFNRIIPIKKLQGIDESFLEELKKGLGNQNYKTLMSGAAYYSDISKALKFDYIVDRDMLKPYIDRFRQTVFFDRLENVLNLKYILDDQIPLMFTNQSCIPKMIDYLPYIGIPINKEEE